MVLRTNSFFLILTLFILTAAVPAGPLSLNIVYPKPDQAMPPVDSTFIFGSVEPGSAVSVNGFPVNVHDDGGWLAFVPVSPGKFSFLVSAMNEGVEDFAKVSVLFPEVPHSPRDSLFIDPMSINPTRELWLGPGDRIDLSFRGTPGCLAYCLIDPGGLIVPLAELPPQSYYINRNVFDSTGQRIVPDSLLIPGFYKGSFNLPDTEADSLSLTFGIAFRLPEEVRRFFRTVLDDSIGNKSPASSILEPFEIEFPYAIKVLDENPRVVELIDSTSVIRTGPGKGYLTVHQPAGIRCELAGKDGIWYKLKMSDYQYGWVIDTACIILPRGETTAKSYIRLIQTLNKDDRVTARIVTSARHPFRVIENTAENSVTLFVYGAEADTDWIRYDNSDDLIEKALWYHPEPGVFAVKFHLSEDRIWGYDGYYNGNELYFDLIKRPYRHQRYSDYRAVIDPGHCPDPGAVGPTGFEEQQANLEIALELKQELEREGIEVIMTRNEYYPLSLYARPDIAVSEKTDIFISIHNNALPDGTNPFVNHGISTFYYHPHSEPLAQAVQNALVRNIDLPDFGLYYGNLAVIRPTQYPAILVECAFMMIPEQEARLKSGAFQEELARAIAEGVKDFIRGRALTEWDKRQNESYNIIKP